MARGRSWAIVAFVHGPPILAIQVVNYRTRAYLERCLTTVVPDVDASGVGYEITLLENASGDELDDLAASYPSCRVFTSERNIGFGGGHNRLASMTGARYLLILNPDVEFISAGTTSRLLAAIAYDGQIKVVGPKLVGANGEPQRFDHGRLRGLRAQLALGGGHSYWRPTDVAQDVAWVSGAALLIDRVTFSEVGGFDENLFLYKEDEDLCLRIRQAGGRIRYEPSITVRHHGSVVADRHDSLQQAASYFFGKHLLNRPAHKLLRALHQGLGYLRL
jgi:N-acetylglucosaminyl-diphospho-decaprenol L-rhamnosyltransferase